MAHVKSDQMFALRSTIFGHSNLDKEGHSRKQFFKFHHIHSKTQKAVFNKRKMKAVTMSTVFSLDGGSLMS